MAKAGKAAHGEKSMDAVVTAVAQRYGEGALMGLDGDALVPVEAISTGALALDIATGIGGVPRGRITEIYGPESSGKTTLALHIIANAQRAGGRAVYIDAEHALDPEWAQVCGVSIAKDKFLLNQPMTGEEGLEVADMVARSGAADVLVIDSVAALVPRAEIEGDMGDSHVGLQARLMSQGLRKITGGLHGTNTACIFINQLREKVGVLFGNPETTSGGRALKFYASLRLDIRRIETLKDGTQSIGNRARVKVVKNKCAPPFRSGEFDIMFGEGISWEGGLIDLGVERDVIVKAGAWYTYGGVNVGQGKEKTREFLKANPTVAAEVAERIRAAAPVKRAPRGGQAPAGDRAVAEVDFSV